MGRRVSGVGFICVSMGCDYVFVWVVGCRVHWLSDAGGQDLARRGNFFGRMCSFSENDSKQN